MWIQEVLFSFFILFIVVDCFGMAQFFFRLTENFRQDRKEEVALRAVSAAFLFALAVVLLSKIVFWVSGITEVDVSLAGGIILLLFSVFFLIESEKEKISAEEPGIMPPGTSLIIKPPVLIVLIFLASSWGVIISLLTFVLNLVLVFLVFKNSKNIVAVFGKNGMKIYSKIMEILLCIFSVFLVRKALEQIFKF